jgi:hypothetical protein
MALRRHFSLKSLAYFFEESKFERAMRLSKEKNKQFFPWSFSGIEPREANLRFLADRMLIVNKIQFPFLLSGLWTTYERTLKCLGEMDISPVKDDLEKTLYDSLNVLIGTMKQEGKSFKLETSEAFTDKKPTVNITDALVYRGLSTDRSLNKSFKQYHVYYDFDIGVICFTDHALSDPLGYLNQSRMQELHSINRRTVLQLLLSIKSSYVLRVLKGTEDISEYNEYSFTQMCVFETQCEEPKGKVKEEKSESYLEWMGKFKPSKFLLTDLNDFLAFNPLVRGSE